MTTTTESHSTARLDWPLNARLAALHCPRTDEHVVSDGEDEVAQPAGSYVTLIYPEVVGDFVYFRNDLKVAAAGGDPDDLSDIELLLDQVPLSEVPMVYELRTSGMACGPVSNRLWVGFDLAGGTT